ncbi:MAG TPA: alkaline phosphatase family protein [Candidatus Cybelea sp.]|jgi:phospholipase C|nr:alkaline phosphatase family protein [Candidatus Cybelea sp.]
MNNIRGAALFPIVALLSSCSSGGSLPSHFGGAGSPNGASGPSTKISHVIILIQENRTFDNLFHGYPGADFADTGVTHTGKVVRLKPGHLVELYDLGHTHANFETEYDGGKDDGFDEVATSPPTTSDLSPYQYVVRSEVRPYFDIAREFTLGDHNFASQNGPSFPGHEYLIAGQAAGAYDDPSDEEPWGCDAPPSATVPVYSGGSYGSVYPCFDYATLGDELDAAKLSWRYYTTPGTKYGVELLPDPYDAVKHIREGSDWANDTVDQPLQIVDDIKKGKLASVSWVNSPALASDHPQLNDGDGPSWIAYVVDALGKSSYYQNTAVLVTWDDWGGWYDHVAPQEYGFLGLGFRVPLLVVSAWSKHGYISSQPHEFGSILKFVEGVYGLPSLGQRDAYADDLSDCFDFNQTPPKFVPIHLITNPYVLRKRLSADKGPNDNY